jgi:hypothetical protein
MVTVQTSEVGATMEGKMLRDPKKGCPTNINQFMKKQLLMPKSLLVQKKIIK